MGQPVKERLATAELLGRAGDPRIGLGFDNFLEVPGLDVRLGKYPVTVDEYRRFVEAGGYEERRHWSAEGWKARTSNRWEAPAEWLEQLEHPNRPVVGVSWYEAGAYRDWLGVELGMDIRLPTENEWERAAMPDGRKYPWGKAEPSPELANFDGNVGSPTPVGLYPAGDGRFWHSDLAGNVWEWSVDAYEKADQGTKLPIACCAAAPG